MYKRLILTCLLVAMSMTTISAQIQRKKTSSTTTSQTQPTTQTQPSKSSTNKAKTQTDDALVIIAIEDGVVYIDRPNGNVNPGDVFEAYEVTKKFTHPVTGEKIDREADVAAQLTVTKVFGKYLECEATPKFALSSLKTGMKVRQLEQAPVFKHEEPQKEVQSKSSVSADEQEFLSLLNQEKAKCPTKKVNGTYTESIVRQGKTIYFNIVIEKGKVFKATQKSINTQNQNIVKAYVSLKNLTFYDLGIKAGYTFIFRYYNNTKDESIEVNINDFIREDQSSLNYL